MNTKFMRTLCVAATLVALLSVTGCGKKEDDTKDNAAGSTTNKTNDSGGAGAGSAKPVMPHAGQ